MMNNIWNQSYNRYKPEDEPKREALCTLGNGYFATRGAAEESACSAIHYPGTYLAGGYNRLKSQVAGKVIENEDLVNWPNWLVLKFKIGEQEWFSLDNVTIVDYKQILDLKSGILNRRIRFIDESKRETILITQRLIHMEYNHLAAIQWIIIPLNWSEKITVHSGLDGAIKNNGVERYKALSNNHLKDAITGKFDVDGVYLKAQTCQSEISMVQASRIQAFFPYVNQEIKRETIEIHNYIAQELVFEVQEKQEIKITKTIAIYTSRDHAISDPLSEAINGVKEAPVFQVLAETQKAAWKRIWNRCDIQLEKNLKHQLLTRLHIFHLFQTVSSNIIDQDVGIPPRGWHGEAYRGHILWDELFIFPFLNYSMPELTRELLMYRFRRLPQARSAAKKAGFTGVIFPWQSGSNGREESQFIHLNPNSGRWIPDHTYLQRHINSAISHNIWKYYEATNDIEFLSFFGSELLFEIARFWASISTYNLQRDRYEIHGVVGPDEYHTGYPDSEEPGLKNNAYTNFMAVCSINYALETISILDEGRKDELFEKLQINESNVDEWKVISRKMFIPFMNEGKIISQFEGYETLAELNWEKYESKYGKAFRLDRILEEEGDTTNRYKISKQADVLMLFYLFSAEKISSLFKSLDYDFDTKNVPANIEYYNKRSSHGSTLSKLVTSWVTARSDRARSWENFQEAIVSDFEDVQGGTTHEGIHLGAMAGTVDLIQRCYTGLEMRDGRLRFNPMLPSELERISFRVRYQRLWINVQLSRQKLHLKCIGHMGTTQHIIVKGEKYALKPGEDLIIDLDMN